MTYLNLLDFIFLAILVNNPDKQLCPIFSGTAGCVLVGTYVLCVYVFVLSSDFL